MKSGGAHFLLFKSRPAVYHAYLEIERDIEIEIERDIEIEREIYRDRKREI